MFCFTFVLIFAARKVKIVKMNQESQRLLSLLMETERVADQVLQNKMEIVELDKRRQSTREALRDINKSNDKKCWITIGPILVKMEKEKAMQLLKKGLFNKLVFI